MQLIDGREFIGILMSVDKTGSIFLQDALEQVPISDKHGFVHDMFTPNMVKVPVPEANAPAYPETNSKVYKYMSNYVIERKHVKRICLDHKA